MTRAPEVESQELSWFKQQRYEWVIESARIFGLIRREHLVAKFRISPQQATKDFTAIKARWPRLLTYDQSEKGYRLTETENVGGWQIPKVPNDPLDQIEHSGLRGAAKLQRTMPNLPPRTTPRHA